MSDAACEGVSGAADRPSLCDCCRGALVSMAHSPVPYCPCQGLWPWVDVLMCQARVNWPVLGP
jgi:hypothetical protein